MKNEIKTDCGTILYEESVWTGKRKLFLNGKELTKVNKKTFVYEENGEKKEFIVEGNIFKGVGIFSSDLPEPVIISKPMGVLDYIFFILPLVPAVLFGAVGGLVGGLTAAFSLSVVRETKPLWLKIVLGIEFAIIGGLAAFLTAFAVGLLILK